MSPERRREVIETAAAHFAEHGYHQGSMNQVQVALGVSKGAFYYWFDDKEDLFLTALEDRLESMVARLREPVETALAAEPFWEAVSTVVRLALEDVSAHPEELALIKAAAASPAPSSARAHGWSMATVTWMQGHLARGQTQGAVRGDLPLALLSQLLFGVLDTMDRALLLGGELEDDVHLVYVDVLRRIAQP